MAPKNLSQEGLKGIACVSMLLDHVGAVFFPECMLLRILGRLAFPIYCYLLVEGAAYTRDPKKYALRLFLGALLSEIPFDLLFFGKLTWEHQNVMVTLLLGLLMILWARTEKRFGFLLPLCVCFFGAELLRVDYGCWGVALIALFAVTAEKKHEKARQLLGLFALSWLMGGATVPILGAQMPVQVFSVAAFIPISLYSGRKGTTYPGVKWAFYLFYPLHMAVMLLAEGLIQGR